MAAAVAWRHLYDGNMHFHDDQSVLWTTVVITREPLLLLTFCTVTKYYVMPTHLSKRTMLDTRISSAAHILMENVTVIYLNTTQAEPLCDCQWRKWADINWWTFITPQGNCMIMIIEISCPVGFSLSKCVGNQTVTEATCKVVEWKAILLSGIILVEP